MTGSNIQGKQNYSEDVQEGSWLDHISINIGAGIDQIPYLQSLRNSPMDRLCSTGAPCFLPGSAKKSTDISAGGPLRMRVVHGAEVVALPWKFW